MSGRRSRRKHRRSDPSPLFDGSMREAPSNVKHALAKHRMDIFDKLPRLVRYAVDESDYLWRIECVPWMVRKYGVQEAVRIILAGEGYETNDETEGNDGALPAEGRSQ
jgi:hypothetical protein